MGCCAGDGHLKLDSARLGKWWIMGVMGEDDLRARKREREGIGKSNLGIRFAVANSKP
jgi:hypothetical protein